MHTFAWRIVIEERRRVLHRMYGEIYGDLERRKPAVHTSDPEEPTRSQSSNGGIWCARHITQGWHKSSVDTRSLYRIDTVKKIDIDDRIGMAGSVQACSSCTI